MYKNIFLLIFVSFLSFSCSQGGGKSNGSESTIKNEVIVLNKNITLYVNGVNKLDIPEDATNLIIEYLPNLGEVIGKDYIANSIIGEDYLELSYVLEGQKYLLKVVIKINKENLAPIIGKKEFFVEKGNGFVLDFEIIDENVNEINYQILSQPSIGSLFFINENNQIKLAYDADNSFYEESFRIKVIDKQGLEDDEIITINSIGPNTSPVVLNTPLEFSLYEDSLGQSITYNVIDNEDSSLIHRIKVNPSHGIITGNYPNYNYIPNQNYNGQDSFQIEVDDQRGGIAIETINLLVNSINDIPVSSNKIFTAVKNSSFNVYDLEILDVDDNEFSYSILNDFTNGIGFINNEGYLTFIPDMDFIGQDTIEYKINDGEGESESYSTIINVIEDNVSFPISLQNESRIINKNELLEIPLVFTGNVGDITVSFSREAVFGTVFIENNNLIYIPQEDYIGNELIELKVIDTENNESNTALISIEIKTKNYNLYGFNVSGNLFKEEFTNELAILENFSIMNSPMMLNNNINSFDITLKNPNLCSELQGEEVKLVNIINNTTFAIKDLTENINISNISCQEDYFSLLENGDTFVHSGNELFLMERNKDIYLGINTLSLLNYSTIEFSTFNSLSFIDISSVEYTKNLGTINDYAFGNYEDSLGSFKNYIKIPNGNVEYNNTLYDYYSLVYSENNLIKTKGIFIKDQNNIMQEITQLNFACEEPEVTIQNAYFEEVEYFQNKTLNDLENDNSIIITDNTDQYSNNIPSGVNYIAVVDNLSTYSSLEDISTIYIIERSNCVNGIETVDVSSDNGIILLYSNKIILSLDYKYDERSFFNENNIEESSIEEIGSHLIIYEY
jgi:hypothetical protein